MTRRINLWWVAAVLLCLPLVSMALLPLSDTSEPRYAEIARLMAQSGDWITPWFEPGKPFWGKPPLSFWTQALSFNLLGVNEFAVRFPSWLSMVATVGLLVAFTRAFFGNCLAQWTAIIYSSCTLVYMTSGAVLTDPFLVLGTTLCMTSFMMARPYPSLFWRYGFFVGLAIGLLAKGPLAMVLVAGPLLLWLLPSRSRFAYFKALPWTRGLLLTAQLQAKCGTPVYYVDERPFSARFYSNGTAQLLRVDEVSVKLDGSALPLWLAVPKKRLSDFAHILNMPLQKRYENKRYILFETVPVPGPISLVTAN